MKNLYCLRVKRTRMIDKQNRTDCFWIIFIIKKIQSISTRSPKEIHIQSGRIKIIFLDIFTRERKFRKIRNSPVRIINDSIVQLCISTCDASTNKEIFCQLGLWWCYLKSIFCVAVLICWPFISCKTKK